MRYNSGFPEYVPVAEKKKKAEKSIVALKKKNPNISPVVITGNKICKTWWGNSWGNNLESYSDYSNRIGRGRSYVRNGAVLDLKITKGKISALVQGSTTKPYKIDIVIDPMTKTLWDTIVKDCVGKIDSLQELLEGKFPKGLSELFTTKGKGLFPSPSQIKLNCSCPDWAIMCKHVAAALYGVGARLDDDPGLFFVLRNINIDELISESLNQKSKAMLDKSKTKSRRVIDDTDISDMFGINLESNDSIEISTKVNTEQVVKALEKKKGGRTVNNTNQRRKP